MALIKNKGDEKFGLCPYCMPFSYQLRYNKSSHTVSCVKCGFVVAIHGIESKEIKDFDNSVYVPPFHWECCKPHLTNNKGVRSHYYDN